MKTHIGVDLHQRFCYLTAVDASGTVLRQGQVVNDGAALRAWLRQVPVPRQVVVEASGFWPAFQRAVQPEAEKIVMVHPQRMKAIASARLKNDRVDSQTLAQLSRADLLPEAWMADEATQQLRLKMRLRVTLGRQRAQMKNQLQAVLHQEGMLKPVTDVFGKRGRAWLETVPLSVEARAAVDLWLRLIGHVDQELAALQQAIEAMAKTDARAKWLVTIPGIAAYSAMLILGEIGDIQRFGTKRALASYAGLTPSVRESAGKRKRGSIGHNGSGPGKGDAALDHAAGGAGGGAPLARRQGLVSTAETAKTRAGGQIALARKLLTAVWALLKHGVCFEESVFAGLN